MIEQDWTVVRFIGRFFTAEQRKATLILVYMAIALCGWKSIPAVPSIDNLAVGSVTTFLFGAQKIFLAFLLFGIVPAALVKFVLKEKLSDYGLQIGNWRRVLFSSAIIVPIAAAMGYFSGMDKSYLTVYPLNPAVSWSADGSLSWFAAHCALYLVFYYLSFEFFFRGFLLRGLSDSCGVINAVLIQAVACACFHFGHPGGELWGSFAGSLFWGFLVLRMNTILGSWIQHATLGIALDFGIIHFLMTP